MKKLDVAAPLYFLDFPLFLTIIAVKSFNRIAHEGFAKGAKKALGIKLRCLSIPLNARE
jgi:hypothetical protein